MIETRRRRHPPGDFIVEVAAIRFRIEDAASGRFGSAR